MIILLTVFTIFTIAYTFMQGIDYGSENRCKRIVENKDLAIADLANKYLTDEEKITRLIKYRRSKK